MPLAEERAMELEAEIPDGVTVTGAEPLLERAVHNIITNALRHSPAGERAVVVLRPGPPDRAQLRRQHPGGRA